MWRTCARCSSRSSRSASCCPCASACSMRRDRRISCCTCSPRTAGSRRRTTARSRFPPTSTCRSTCGASSRSTYKALFSAQAAREDHRALFTEYFWDMSWCDPCAADPLTPAELREAGVYWAGATRGRGGGQPVMLTRLHLRYTRDSLPEDLVFQETQDRTNFQARYVLRHPWTGAADACEAAKPYFAEVDAPPRARSADARVADRVAPRRCPRADGVAGEAAAALVGVVVEMTGARPFDRLRESVESPRPRGTRCCATPGCSRSRSSPRCCRSARSRATSRCCRSRWRWRSPRDLPRRWPGFACCASSTAACCPRSSRASACRSCCARTPCGSTRSRPRSRSPPSSCCASTASTSATRPTWA